MTLIRAVRRYFMYTFVALLLSTIAPVNVVPGELHDLCFKAGGFPFSCRYVPDDETKTAPLVTMPASILYANTLLAGNGVTPLPWPHVTRFIDISFTQASNELGLAARWSGLTSLGKLQGEYARAQCGPACFSEQMIETIGDQQVQVHLKVTDGERQYEVVVFDGEQHCQVTITLVAYGREEAEVSSSYYCDHAFDPENAPEIRWTQ